MRGSKNFRQRGSNSDVILEEERDGHYTSKSGPSSDCQRNAIEMAFRWRADDGPTLNAGLFFSGDLAQYC